MYTVSPTRLLGGWPSANLLRLLRAPCDFSGPRSPNKSQGARSSHSKLAEGHPPRAYPGPLRAASNARSKEAPAGAFPSPLTPPSRPPPGIADIKRPDRGEDSATTETKPSSPNREASSQTVLVVFGQSSIFRAVPAAPTPFQKVKGFAPQLLGGCRRGRPDPKNKRMPAVPTSMHQKPKCEALSQRPYGKSRQPRCSHNVHAAPSRQARFETKCRRKDPTVRADKHAATIRQARCTQPPEITSRVPSWTRER